MGCDIHTFVEVRKGDRWEPTGPIFPTSPIFPLDITVRKASEFGKEWEKRDFTEHPFDRRAYGMFGFLANVRNYSHVPTIAEPKHSFPPDVSDVIKTMWDCDNGHTLTWLTLRQLSEFDYDQVFWDRRVSKQTGPNSWTGAGLAEDGEGEHLTIRDFLGTDFFRDITIMSTLGSLDDVRVVFWFDN